MESLADAVREITQTIFVTVFDREAYDGAPPGDAELARAVASWVHISGAWDGSVLVQLPRPLALQLAGTMFASDPAAVTPEELRDAMGEIANMIGGNLKAVLPAPSRLSLPSHAMEGLGGEVVHVNGASERVDLACEGAFVVVTVSRPREGASNP